MIENFVQTVSVAELSVDGDRLELAIPQAPFRLPLAGSGYLLLMKRRSENGACIPIDVEIVAYDGYEDDEVTLKIMDRGVGDTVAKKWGVGTVVQQPFMKEHYLSLLAKLDDGLALGIDNAKDILKLFLSLMKQSGQLSINTEQLADLVDQYTLLKKNDESLQAQLNELGAVLAWQAEAEASYRRTMGQSGLFGVRQYTYHADYQPHTENGQPAHMHNHPQYRDLLGSGEVQFCINGYLGKTRHRDYHLVAPAASGNKFLKTERIEPPALPSSIKGSLEEQTTAMRNLFSRYQEGEFPEGFGWTMSAIECWFEPFSDRVYDAFHSDRHQQEVISVGAALRSLLRFSGGGSRNMTENVSMEMPLCRWVDQKGKAVIGILKHRMVCVDVSSLGDLRPYIDSVSDPIRANAGQTSNRFLIREENNKPGKLDEMMGLLVGLDGFGANIKEKYSAGGSNSYIVHEYHTDAELNAAYYTRFVRSADEDASNRIKFKRGFNDPYLFVASNTRKEVLNTALDGVDYRFSYAIPMELILRTPLERWNPYGFNTVDYQSITGKGTKNEPFNANSTNKYWFRTPEPFFSGKSFADVADTVGDGVWVKDPAGESHFVKESGLWNELPQIAGCTGRIRQRYAIFPDHSEGGKAFRHAEAASEQHLALAVSNTTDILRHEQMSRSNEIRFEAMMRDKAASDKSADAIHRELEKDLKDSLALGVSNAVDILKSAEVSL